MLLHRIVRARRYHSSAPIAPSRSDRVVHSEHRPPPAGKRVVRSCRKPTPPQAVAGVPNGGDFEPGRSVVSGHGGAPQGCRGVGHDQSIPNWTTSAWAGGQLYASLRPCLTSEVATSGPRDRLWRSRPSDRRPASRSRPVTRLPCDVPSRRDPDILSSLGLRVPPRDHRRPRVLASPTRVVTKSLMTCRARWGSRIAARPGDQAGRASRPCR